MTHDPIATRYAQAVFESAKAEEAIDPTLEQLSLIGTLMQQHAELRELMGNPDVDPPDKLGLLECVLKGSWSSLVRAFVQLVISSGRSEFLPEIAQAFQEMVDDEQGVVRVTVRSAHPLSAATLNRVQQHLKQGERRQVNITTEVVPALLGGFQLVLGYRVIDSSVRRQLDDLREQLIRVRVSS